MTRLARLAAALAAPLLACAHAEPAPPPRAAAPAPAAMPPTEAQVAPARPAKPSLMAEEPFRVGRPAPLPEAAPFNAPVPVERRLKSGARLLVVTNHATPLVAVELRFLHGADADPRGKPGLSGFAAAAALEGTRRRTAQALTRAIEDLAAELTTDADQESSGAHLNCLTETLPQALALVAEVLREPAFRDEDVERVRTLRLAQLDQKRASIALLARDEANRILYGPDHPWGQPEGGTPESLRAITRKDLAAWHRAFWTPADLVIAVAGDVEPDEAVRRLDAAFAGWKGRPATKPVLPAIVPPQTRSIAWLDRPGATQSQVWVVGPLFPASGPDALALRIANFALGGVFSSRLNLNLREQHGYSYGVFSALRLGRTAGSFQAAGGVVAASTPPAVAEYEKELTRFATGDLTEAEFERSRDMFVRGLPALLETVDAVSSSIARLAVLGMPLDYYRSAPARAAALTREETAEVVRRWMHPERWPIVVVGAMGDHRAALEKLGQGAVEVRTLP
ncbi:MAG: pitrilysin family protein [Anaeromyxobacteraceae bacterium]